MIKKRYTNKLFNTHRYTLRRIRSSVLSLTDLIFVRLVIWRFRLFFYSTWSYVISFYINIKFNVFARSWIDRIVSAFNFNRKNY